jgi:hypothetical protein
LEKDRVGDKAQLEGVAVMAIDRAWDGVIVTVVLPTTATTGMAAPSTTVRATSLEEE